jgi:hypothetical protein
VEWAPGVDWAPGVGRGALGPELVFMGVLLVGCGPDAGLVLDWCRVLTGSDRLGSGVADR